MTADRADRADDADNADLDLARTAARQAGELVMRYFGSDLVVQHKAPDQPLTEADLAADALLRKVLTSARPDYGWLSEETIDTPDRLARERVWIVDPIDGTRSFIARRPEFTISIGLAVAGKAVAGVVYNPATDELFHALRGHGAHGEYGGRAAVALRVRDAGAERTILASRSEIEAGDFAGFAAGWQVEPVGSTAYKLARIAAGSGDVFVSRGPKSEWDICAGVLIVREAGGRATDLSGAEPAFNGTDPYVHGILATNGTLHDAVIRRAAELPPSVRLRRREEG